MLQYFIYDYLLTLEFNKHTDLQHVLLQCFLISFMVISDKKMNEVSSQSGSERLKSQITRKIGMNMFLEF